MIEFEDDTACTAPEIASGAYKTYFGGTFPKSDGVTTVDRPSHERDLFRPASVNAGSSSTVCQNMESMISRGLTVPAPIVSVGTCGHSFIDTYNAMQGMTRLGIKTVLIDHTNATASIAASVAGLRQTLFAWQRTLPMGKTEPATSIRDIAQYGEKLSRPFNQDEAQAYKAFLDDFFD